jgi:hypothetical protein
MEVGNLEQLASSVDAEDPEADTEDNDNLKPKKRVVTSKAARKKRRNGSEDEKSSVKSSESDQVGTNSNAEHALDKLTSNEGEKSDKITRRSSRNKVKPQSSKSKGR